MKDHKPYCEMRIFVGSLKCTCDAVEEDFDGRTTNEITDVEAPPKPAHALPERSGSGLDKLRWFHPQPTAATEGDFADGWIEANRVWREKIEALIKELK